jgi:hypothetical protein
MSERIIITVVCTSSLASTFADVETDQHEKCYHPDIVKLLHQ